MEFLDARCPNCGGQLKVPSDRATIKCMYCSSDILVRDSISKAAGVNIENLLKLSQEAFAAKNYEESYQYCSRVLEVDADNPDAWYGKGLAAGWLSDITKYRLIELVNCMTNAIKYINNSKRESTIQKAVFDINSIAMSCFYISKNHCEAYLHIGNTWAEHIYRTEEVIVCLTEANKMDDTNAIVMKNIILVCTDLIKGRYHRPTSKHDNSVKYRIKSDYEDKLRNKIEFYSAKIKLQEPNYQVPIITKAGMCFIATATMGDSDHPTVIQLRAFRDTWLLDRSWGQIFIDRYYRCSPPLAALIAKHTFLRRCSLILLINPLLRLVKLLLRREK